MRKPLLRDIILILAILFASIWLFRKLQHLPAISSLFRSQPVVIDQTPILIKEIKTIAQLVTVTAYDEVVADSIVFTKRAAVIDAFRSILPVLPSARKQLVLIAKGKVLAGTNLQQLSAENFTINNDTITLRLPRAVILETIINPSDFETFEEQGKWSEAEVQAVKATARRKIVERALQRNILQKADTKAKAIMESFLLNAGYKVVYVQVV